MMLKQSPSRNQRSKGFKVKHALQIFVLLAICIWLLYQVKHSHDKNKIYEENSEKLSEKEQSGHEILALGRKGFRPRVEETASENEKSSEEEEEEESKVEENEDEIRGGGDDEIDGHDQGRGEEEEYEQGEDLIDEQDEDREEGIEEIEGEEKENHVEDSNLLEDQDHNQVEINSQEAQEEHYKRDDASSAVVHNTQTISTETEKIRLRKVKEEEQGENAENSELEQENITDNKEAVNFDEKDSTPKVGSEQEGNGFNLSDTKVGSNFIYSTKAVSNEDPKVNTSSTLMQGENVHGSLGRTYILPLPMSMPLQDQNVTSNEILSNMQIVVLGKSAENEQSDLDSTLSPMNDNLNATKKETIDSSSDSESVATDEIEESSASITANKSNETDHSGDLSTTTEILDAVQNESFDSSDSALYQEDREDNADLVTLPEFEIRTSNSEDADE